VGLRKILPVAWLLIFFAESGQAFPTLTRKGYTSCATCHYNPSGGGALTAYGKYIAQEVYGTFNDSSNAIPFMVTPKYEVGAFEEPLLVAQGMIRAVQVLSDGAKVRTYKTNRMQLDLELGLAKNGWQALATIGPRLDSAIPGESEKSTLSTRRWWIGRVILEYAIRAGKFMPEFGINHPNHNIPTRKGLFFNHNEEPQLVQATKFSETFDYTIGYLQGSKNTELADKKGASATVAYKTGMSRYGVSALSMRLRDVDGTEEDAAGGVFAQIGHLQHYYLLAELDRKEKSRLGKKIRSNLGYGELGWEFGKGMSTYLSYEFTHGLDEKRIVKTPSVGFLIYPVTHTEIALQMGRSYLRSSDYGMVAANRGLIMANIYF
jgi:hypothetical protein